MAPSFAMAPCCLPGACVCCVRLVAVAAWLRYGCGMTAVGLRYDCDWIVVRLRPSCDMLGHGYGNVTVGVTAIIAAMSRYGYGRR